MGFGRNIGAYHKMTGISKTLSCRFQSMAFFCACLVVVIHSFPGMGSVEEHGVGMWWMMKFIKAGLCQIAVPFFFLSSGYFLAGHFNDEKWYRCEIRKRLKTLVVPYFAWNMLYILMEVAFGWQIEGVFTAIGVGFGKPALSSLWFVRSLFLLVLVSPLLAKLLWTRRSALITLICFYLLYGFFAPWAWTKSDLSWLLFYHFSLLGLFWFSLGIALRIHVLNDLPRHLNSVALVVGIVLLSLKVFAERCGYAHSYYFGWLAIPFLMYITWHLMPSRVPFPRIASCSFGIYLIHKFFIAIFSKEVFGCGVIGHLTYCILIIVLSVLAAFLIKNLKIAAMILYGGRE